MVNVKNVKQKEEKNIYLKQLNDLYNEKKKYDDDYNTKKNKLKTFLKDKDNGGYVKGIMNITDDYIIYEVDNEISMILVKE